MNGDNRRRIDGARDVLVGIIPDPKGQVEQITTALIYKYLHELDCRAVAAGGRRAFFVGKYEGFAWDKLLSPQISGDEKLKLYREATETMAANEKLPPVFRDMLRGADSPFRNAKVLGLFLKEIDGLDCADTEDLGDAYEHLLSIMGTQGDAGQFRTPRHIIDFIVAIVNPKKGERILDPACGSAGFLTAAHKHIMAANSDKRPGDKLTQTEKTALPKNIIGRDIDPGMARLATVNLYLHGVKMPQVAEYDTLSDDTFWREQYAVILANPPFMTPKGGIQPHDRFRVNARRAEVLFVDYIAEHLHATGRAGIVVPEGIIFQSQRAYKDLRKMLISEWGLYAVASLPSGIFQPYSGVKTSVLFLDRMRRSYKNILFVKIENDGFDLGAKRAPVSGSDLPEARRIICEWDGKKIKNKIAQVVAKDKIAEDGEYNLVGDRYIEIAANVGAYPMVKLGDYIEEQRQRIGNKIVEVFSISNTKGFINPNKQFGKKIASDNISNYKQVAAGDFAYNPARINVGSVAINSTAQHGAVSPMYVVFRIKDEKLHPSYLLSLLKSKEGIKHIRANAHGSIRQMLTFGGISSLVIPLPPMEEQKRIVAEIENYEKVRQGAQQIVDNWRPVINVNPAWTMVELNKICAVRRGQAITKKDVAVGDVPVIAGGQKPAYFHNCSNRNGDTITISGSGAYAGFVNFFAQPIFASDCTTIQANGEELDMKFVYCMLKNIQQEIYSLRSGMAQPHVYAKDVATVKIPLPPLKEQKRIVAEIKSEEQAVAECRELAEKMAEKIAATLAKVWGEKK